MLQNLSGMLQLHYVKHAQAQHHTGMVLNAQLAPMQTQQNHIGIQQHKRVALAHHQHHIGMVQNVQIHPLVHQWDYMMV